LSAAILEAEREEALVRKERPITLMGGRGFSGWSVHGWVVTGAVASFLLFGGLWVSIRDLVPMGGRPADGASPFNKNDRVTALPFKPFKVFLEQDLLQSDVVPADDGSPLRRDVLERRRTLLDDSSPGNLKSGSGTPPRLDMERVDLRY